MTGFGTFCKYVKIETTIKNFSHRCGLYGVNVISFWLQPVESFLPTGHMP